jgi:dynein light chain LC8-type
MTQSKIQEKILDMDDSIKIHCIEFIARAFNEESSEKAIAEFIKSKLEEKEDGKWNVVIGRNFGSHVVHRSRRYGYFLMGEISILIWQTSTALDK